MYKNVNIFHDSQNYATSFKIISKGSPLFSFVCHINSAMYVAIFTYICHFINIFGLILGARVNKSLKFNLMIIIL